MTMPSQERERATEYFLVMLTASNENIFGVSEGDVDTLLHPAEQTKGSGCSRMRATPKRRILGHSGHPANVTYLGEGSPLLEVEDVQLSPLVKKKSGTGKF